MLSKELQELEQNDLISRAVMNIKPVTVSYAPTTHGKTLEKLIHEIGQWGISHRKHIMYSGK